MYSKKIPCRAIAFGILLIVLFTGLGGIGLRAIRSTKTPASSAPTTPPLLATPIPYQEGWDIPARYQIEAQAAYSGWTPALHSAAAAFYEHMGDLSGAVAHWEAAQLTDVASVEHLASVYITLQRWPEAIDALKRLLGIDPQRPWAHYQLGLLQVGLDPLAAASHLAVSARSPMYGEVSTDLLAVTQDNPADPFISMRVGLVLAQYALWPQAELAFRQAAIIGQPYPEALAYVGWTRAKQGKSSFPWMEQALAFGSEVPQVYYLYGLCLRQQLDYEGSRAAFMQAVALDPNNPAYYAELGMANSLLFDEEQAEHWLQSAVTVSGNAPEFQQLLDAFAAESNNGLWPENLSPFELFRDYIPQDPESLTSFGRTLYEMGDTVGALTELDAALALSPEYPQALYYKATILLTTDEPEQALSLLRQLAELDSFYSSWAEYQLHLLEPRMGE